MSQAANTAYHEARHGEQWHAMARLRAGKYGETVAQIKAAMPGVNEAMITDAHGKPAGTSVIPADPLFQTWFDSVYGTNRPHRDRVLKEMPLKEKEWKDKLKETNDAAKKSDEKAKETEEKKKIFDAKQAELTTLQTALAAAKATADAKEAARVAKKSDRDAKDAVYRPAYIAYDQAGNATLDAQSVRNAKKTAADEKKRAEDAARVPRDNADAERTTKGLALKRAEQAYNDKMTRYRALYDAWNTATGDAKNAAATTANQFHTVTLSMRGTTYVRPTDPRLSTMILHAAEETGIVHTLSIGAATADRFPRVADLKSRLGSFVESARSHYQQPITLVFHVPANAARNTVAYDLNVELADDGAAALDDRRVVSVTFVGPR